MMNLSPYVHAFEIEKGVTCLYNSLTLKKIFLNKSSYNSLLADLQANKKSETIAVLENLSFLTTKEIDLGKLFEKYTEIVLPQQTNIANFFVILTDLCNYDCKYCYIERPLRKGCDKPHNVMSMDTAKLVLQSILANSRVDTKAKLNFYGGEPLLNKEVMLFLLKEVKRERPSIKPQIVTNGSQVTEEIAQILKEYGVFTTVSLDGWADINNRARVYVGGHPTYDDTIRGIKILQKYDMLAAISCTVSFHNYDKLIQIMMFFKELDIKNVGLNYLISDTMSGNVLDPAEVADKMFEAFLKAREIGIFEGSIGDKRVKHLWLERPRRTDCTGCGTQIYYSPKGFMGPCQAFYWTTEEQIPLDPNLKVSVHPLWEKWARRTPYRIKDCFNCEALGVCGGGCPYNSYILHKDINALDKNYCKFMKRIMQRLIRYYYDTEVKKNISVQ